MRVRHQWLVARAREAGPCSPGLEDRDGAPALNWASCEDSMPKTRKLKDGWLEITPDEGGAPYFWHKASFPSAVQSTSAISALPLLLK